MHMSQERVRLSEVRSFSGRVSRKSKGVWQTARPRQWVKNVLVFLAPVAAGLLSHPIALWKSAAAFAIVSLAASGTYFLNDARDAAGDQQHPQKRNRPVAAGTISPSLAYVIAAALIIVSLTLAVMVLNPRSAATVALYCTMTTCYSWRLKHVAILDLIVLAAGFVLRVILGAVAVGASISSYFLIVTAFGSLFMVAGKRAAELHVLREEAAAHRPILRTYTHPFLVRIQALAATVSVTVYCLWAFGLGASSAAGGQESGWFQLSVAPFVAGLFRYSLHLESGHGGAPEDLALSDRFLQVSAFFWFVLVGVGIYA